MNKKYLIFTVVGISLFIFGMTFVIPGGDREMPDIDSDKLDIPDFCRAFSANWDESQLKCSGGGLGKSECEQKGGSWIESTNKRICIFENYSP